LLYIKSLKTLKHKSLEKLFLAENNQSFKNKCLYLTVTKKKLSSLCLLLQFISKEEKDNILILVEKTRYFLFFSKFVFEMQTQIFFVPPKKSQLPFLH